VDTPSTNPGKASDDDGADGNFQFAALLDFTSSDRQLRHTVLVMTLIFWTKPPSLVPVVNALRTVRAGRFLDATANQCLWAASLALAKDTWFFLQSAALEVFVNLRNGLPRKRRAFEKRLDAMLTSSNRENIDASGLILEMLNTRYVLRGNVAALSAVLVRQEPLLVVSNHPYAPIDGLMLMSMVHQYRNDYALLVNANNGLMSLRDEFGFRFIPVDLSEGQLKTADINVVRNSRVKAIKTTLEYLEKSRKCIIFFPAGNISKAIAWEEEITDTTWLDGIGFLVRHFAKRHDRLTVQPVYIDTHMGSENNSQRYQEAFLESTRYVSAALMHAFFHPPSTIDVHVGDPLSAVDFSGMSNQDITNTLRSKVYMHAPAIRRATPRRSRSKLLTLLF